MAQIIIHTGRNAARAPTQAPQPQQRPQATQPINIPARDLSEYKTIVKPRFMGNDFVYVPERVMTRHPDGSPVRSAGELFLDWLFGTKR